MSNRALNRLLITIPALAAGTMMVAACQQLGSPRDASAGFLADSGFGLHFVDTGDGAKLAYGKQDSESLGLMLECFAGSDSIEISDVARGAETLTLRAGGQQSEFAGEIGPAPQAPVLIAQAKPDAPVLRAFRQSGKVEVVNGALRYDVKANAEERADVERFFAACERAA